MVNPFSLFQPLPHSAISVGVKALILLLAYFLCQICIFLHSAKPMHKTVISASGYLEQPAHNGYRILCPVAADDRVFCSRPHFLPVDRRKSRSNSFSIRKRLISYACSATISLGAASFLGLPLGCGMMPAASFLCLRRSRFSSPFTTYLSLKPKCSATSR